MKNEYKVTKQLMKSWVKRYSFRGAANIVNFIICCVMGVIGMFALAFFCVVQDWVNVCLSGFIIFVCVFRLFFARFVTINQAYKYLVKTYGVSEWMISFEFLEDEIVVKDHTSVSVFNYSLIREVEEDGDLVILYLSNDAALRLYKNSFVEGTWQECRALIFKKTGI